MTIWLNVGLLKRTCPLLNDVSARRSLYLALVKSQLSYATQVWSPDKIALKTQIERVQRRATRWILKQRVGVMSYRDRLLTLKLLPLTFDRELKDLVFFYKCRNGFTDLNVYDFVSPVSHFLIQSLIQSWVSKWSFFTSHIWTPF